MKVARLKIVDGDSVSVRNHHPGINQPFDISLCGQDLMGDRIGTEQWEIADKVDGKIDCPSCLRIISECRRLKKGKDF